MWLSACLWYGCKEIKLQ